MGIRCGSPCWVRVLHRATGPRGQLPAGGLGAVDHPGDVCKGHVEDVMQQERGALQWRQPVQRQQQRERQVVCQFRRGVRGETFGIEHRFGEPGADIDLALRLRALQPVEAESGDDGDEEGFRIANVLRPGEAEVGVLHGVLSIASATEHAIGKAQQPPAIRRQRIGLMRPV